MLYLASEVMENFHQSLKLMGMGMGGIFAVLGIIALCVLALAKITNMKKK